MIGFIILYILIDNKNRPDTFAGASDTTPGLAGYIPAPKAGQENYVLNGAGTWKPPIYLLSSFYLAGQDEIEIGMFNLSYSKRITVMINSVNIKSGSIPILQIGSGTTKKDDYFSVAAYTGKNMESGNFKNGWYVTSNSGDFHYSGNYYITNNGNNLWTCTGSFASNNSDISFCSGSVILSGVLDKVRFATSRESDLFTSGTMSIMYD